MKHRTIYLLFIIFSLLMYSSQIDARKLIPDSTDNQGSGKVKAEDCKAATAFNYLDLNNVRCRINTGGDMWWDLQSLPQYEIPKGSKKHSMFSAALWIGGKDVNGNIRVAAQRYRGYGNDFYTGPLTTDGLADVSPAKCKEFDRHFILYRSDVEKFAAAKANPELYEGYQRPAYFDEYPAHGDVSQGYSYYLAPFYDTDGDGDYNPAAGDYPYYDLKNELTIEDPTPTMAGNGILKDQILKGDMTLFWIFNDKGAPHTETRGDPIGFEIRGQAFAFSTNDELNDMTFYSYEIINRSTFSLDSTYFSQWVDPDVGYAQDDYLGCDVKRGLGYCYNGEATDGTGQQAHYGDNPPAIGVDFFQGPYMDPEIDTIDGEAIIVDRPAKDSLGQPLCDESINGLNFGDSIPGNERFGMRRFLYHNNTGGDLGDPSTYDEYYWMLKGFWKGGREYPMQFGGDAYPGHPNVSPVRCTFMFPGDTDPCWWGTKHDDDPTKPGINVIDEYGWTPSEEGVYWTEKNEGNDPDDRRFMQSAGPFTLKPGAVNYITVGIPWVPGTGDVTTTLNNLKKADDLCQDLFIQNFRIINGPDAPVVEVQELNEQLVLYLDYLPCQPGSLSNYGSGCNYQGKYEEYDYTIKNVPGEPKKDTLYRFEGYQVYQVKNASVSATDLDDPAKARLIAQCDVKNGVGRLINYTTNATLGVEEAEMMVDGSDQGIKHTFVVSRDQFATEGDKLVNNKRYYFMAIAYAYNEWQQYIPGIGGQEGQRTPYLGSRKSSGGGSIRAVEAIPHIPTVENGGTVLNSEYGDGVEITRLEGTGNGELPLRLKDESIEDIMDGESPFPVVDSLPGNDWRHDILQYQQGYGPLDIKVVDPLNVVESDFSLRFATENIDWSHPSSTLSQAFYEIVDLNNQNEIESHRAIDVKYEQLLIDYGISVSVFQPKPIAQDKPRFNLMYDDAFIEAEKLYENEQLEWLTGVPDNDLNINNDDWIASGTVQGSDYGLQITNPITGRTEKWYYDQTEQFENVLGGTWAPYGLTKVVSVGGPAAAASNSDIKDFVKLKELNSVLVVITNDQSKWTRSPVVETGGNYTASSSDDLIEGRIEEDGDTIFPNRMSLRYGKSIDKDGNPWSGHDTVSSDNPNDPNYIGGYGMGWFPGYAINLETGERLNIIYGENSKYCPENGYDDETGRDMMWNPTSTYNPSNDEQIRGGMHYVYIMDIGVDTVGATFGAPYIMDMPGYDAGKYIYDIYHTPSSQFNGDLRRVAFQKAMWTSMPFVAEGHEFLESDLQIYMNVSRQYKRYYATTDEDNMGIVQENDGYPYYEFNTRGLGTTTGNKQTAENALDLIRIVPNPYNAFSDYEEDQLDTRIRITNLPVKCNISIYTINGVLIREYTRDDKTITSQDWDLKNYAGIPISSGVYLIHVDAEGIGERVLKFFCTMRPTDLNAF